MKEIQPINPFSGEMIRSYAQHTPAEVEGALTRAQTGFEAWREAGMQMRSAVLMRVAERLEQRRDELARLAVTEMGKTLKSAYAEVEKCASCCRYFAEHGPAMLQDLHISTEFSRSFAAFQPLGVVLGVMPWNFPFWQVVRFAAPTLMAGNTVLLKHASNVPSSALAIEEVFREADAPEGVLQTLLIGSAGVAPLIADRRVKAVSLTGSTGAGKAVAEIAGRYLKKCVLELGGSDPYLVFADADVEEAARLCAESRLLNNGQSCIAAKRFIVSREVRKAFEQALNAEFEKQTMGDPLQPSTTLGPLARADLREELHAQVERSIAQGARLVMGGEIPPGKGAFYPPTILSDVTPGMVAFDEETFGPVAAITEARDAEEAIMLANRTSYGLGAAIFTRDVEKALALARALEAGNVFINAYVRSDSRLPFGGVKESGYGRELSPFGIQEFVNIKTVAVQ